MGKSPMWSLPDSLRSTIRIGDGQYAQSTSEVAIVDSKERARLREACAGGGATACQKRRIGWGGPETHANPNRFTEVKFPDVKALHQAKQCLRRPIL